VLQAKGLLIKILFLNAEKPEFFEGVELELYLFYNFNKSLHEFVYFCYFNISNGLFDNLINGVLTSIILISSFFSY